MDAELQLRTAHPGPPRRAEKHPKILSHERGGAACPARGSSLWCSTAGADFGATARGDAGDGSDGAPGSAVSVGVRGWAPPVVLLHFRTETPPSPGCGGGDMGGLRGPPLFPMGIIPEQEKASSHSVGWGRCQKEPPAMTGALPWLCLNFPGKQSPPRSPQPLPAAHHPLPTPPPSFPPGIQVIQSRNCRSSQAPASSGRQ